MAKKVKRIGVFGGTFNPIHMGHVALAQNVYKDFMLDELIFIPSNIPPHKQAIGATSSQRYEMTLLTAQELDGDYSVSDYEIKNSDVSYTYKTLTYLRKVYPDDIIFFIAGSDIFATIETWQSWRELFALANFVVANRDGMGFDKLLSAIPIELHSRLKKDEDSKKEKNGNIFLYTMDPVLISSTQIRSKMAEDRCPEMLPEVVYNYIVENNLYMRGK